MAGLKAFPHIWEKMELLDHQTFRNVGWTIMWNLAIAQLRNGRSIVLDGVARDPEIERTREIAESVSARSFVILCSVTGTDLHAARISDRVRNIPLWPELKWGDVQRTVANFEISEKVDLRLDTAEPIEISRDDILSALSRDGH